MVALQRLDHEVPIVLKFRVKMTIKGYIIEFKIGFTQYFSKVENWFKKGSYKGHVKEAATYLKMFPVALTQQI